MKEVNELHEQAMEFFDQAFLARREDNKTLSTELFRKALKLETEAAEILKDDLSAEPSRSVLYQSAASIAVQCQELDLAEKLIIRALSGNPPLEIVNELNDLLKKVKSSNKPKSVRGKRTGVVTSDKTTKTVIVRTDRLIKHPKYRKYVRRKKQFMTHDERGAKIRDQVRIVETRPPSTRRLRRSTEMTKKTEK